MADEIRQPLGTLTLCNNKGGRQFNHGVSSSIVYADLYPDGTATWKSRDVPGGDCNGSGLWGGAWQSWSAISGYLEIDSLTIRMKAPNGPGIHTGTGTIELGTSWGGYDKYFSPVNAWGLNVTWEAKPQKWSRSAMSDTGWTTYRLDTYNYAGKA